jgi:hypothetical protein
VRESIEGDLKVSIQFYFYTLLRKMHVYKEALVSMDQAVKAAEMGCTGLEELTSKREIELEGIKEEAGQVKKELKSIQSSH